MGTLKTQEWKTQHPENYARKKQDWNTWHWKIKEENGRPMQAMKG